MNNSLTNLINENGNANWLITIYSYLGMGPFSYPPTLQFLLSDISQLAGITIEEAVFLFSIILGIFGTLVAFVLTHEITKNLTMSLLGAFFFSTYPIFVHFTYWNGSSRPLLMVFLMFFMFIILRTSYAKRTEQHSNYYEEKFIVLSLIILLIIPTIHRMSLFVVFIIFSFMLARPIVHVMKRYYLGKGIRAGMILLKRSILFFILWFGAILFLILAQFTNIGPYDQMTLWSSYRNGYLFSGTQINILFINMVIDYWSSLGVLSVFAIIGSLYLFIKRKIEFPIFFLLLSILLITPLATLGLYTSLIFAVLILPLIPIGFIFVINIKKIKKYIIPTTIVLLLVSIGFSSFMMEHWLHSKNEQINTHEYNTGLFMRMYINQDETYVTNNLGIGNKVMFVSNSRFLTERYPYTLSFGWIEKEDLDNYIDINGMIENRSIEIRYPEEFEVTIDHRSILENDVDAPKSVYIQEMYNVRYIVESPESATAYTATPSLENSRYVIFTNEAGRIWYVG